MSFSKFLVFVLPAIFQLFHFIVWELFRDIASFLFSSLSFRRYHNSILFSLCLKADGYIARRWPGQNSSLGAIIDPVADKVLVGVLSICLSWNGLMPSELQRRTICFRVFQTGVVFWRMLGQGPNASRCSMTHIFLESTVCV